MVFLFTAVHSEHVSCDVPTCPDQTVATLFPKRQSVSPQYSKSIIVIIIIIII